MSKVCSGCGLKIYERFYLHAIEQQWHSECLKCSTCNIPLGNNLTCFARDGLIYCKEDYLRTYQVKQSCARCSGLIAPNELVMRARELVFHLPCFVCVVCLRVLTKGMEFCMRDSALFCKDHIDIDQGPQQYFNGSGPGQKGRPRKRKEEFPGENGGGMMGDELSYTGYESSSSSCPAGAGGQRTKRMRTSFKHHQLRTMKSYFAINQNPDAKDLKQLAQKTGLSKRVLQVWFQNARAKWRRNILRSEPKSGPTSPSAEMDGMDGMDGMEEGDGLSSSEVYCE